jgi:hypothetical protein
MLKSCKVCTKEFTTKDSRQKTCGKVCANQSRKSWRRNKTVNQNSLKPVRPIVSTVQLPDPEDLPAPYAKRVADMWLSLVGEDHYTTRIA